MDFQTLKAQVLARLDGSNLLTLGKGDIESAAVDELFTQFLGDGGSLVVAGAGPADSDDAAERLSVRGTGVGGLFGGMSVEAVFTIRPQPSPEAQLFLTASSPTDWTLAGSLAALAASPLLSALKFSPGARLYLSTYEEPGVAPQGLFFSGEAVVSSALGIFAYLLGDDARQQLQGPISFNHGVPGFKFEKPETTQQAASPVRLGFFDVPPITLSLNAVALDTGDKTIPKTFCTFDTSIPFSAQGESHAVPVSAEVYNGEEDIIFRSNLTGALDAALDELKSLADGLPLDGLTQGLSGFDLASVLQLQDIEISVNPRAQVVNFISFGVESARTWTLARNPARNTAITLEKVSLSFILLAPGGARKLMLQLGGEIDIGGGQIHLTGSYPDFAVSAWLQDGSVIKLQDVASYFLGSAGTEAPDMEVTEFDLDIQPGAEYSARVEVMGYWPIRVGSTTLAIEEALFAFDYVPNGSTSVTLEGRFDVADIEFCVSAEYPGADAGWLFQGYTLSEDVLNLTEIVARLMELFGTSTSTGLPDISLDNILIAFNPQTKYFKFSCETKMAVGGEQKLDMLVGVELVPEGAGHRTNISDTLTVGSLQFDVHYTQSSAADIFLTTYTHKPEDGGLKLKELIGAISAQVADYIPESLEIDLKDVLFGFRKSLAAQPGQTTQTTAETKFIFGFDIGASVSLSDLPLVGRNFPSDQAVGVEDLQFLIASKPLTQGEVADYNDIISALPTPVTRLPSSSQSGGASQTVVPDGLTVSARMNFGGSPTTLSLPVAGGGAQGAPGAQPATTANTQASSDKAKWFSLQKSFGPVYFDKVGVLYQDGTLWFLLSASLSVAGLTLSLDGLAIGSPIKGFQPKFDLRGLGIQYAGGGAVEIGGAFLRIPKEVSKKTYDEYDGAALIKAGQLKLSAIGSYAELDGHPSLFVYAVLDYPIGGPSFFFVTGLAAGFGYNRSLLVPSIESIAQFPLVADALSGAAMPPNVGDKVKSLQQYIPPTVGEYFLAVGIKFTSFKLIDSFALLTVSFGTQFEVNLLGLSTLIVPTPIPGQNITPLAEVQLAVRATYNPAQGFLGVAAQLTSNSFILSRDCHLTGGFAFYSWFSGEHKGDFVLSLGGYHPDYNVPAHYPRVPRLGFNWRVDSKLSIKGGTYYALTAAALMAGGSLQATWDSGDLKAHFTAGADFIIYWRPYHYDAKVYIDIGVSYTYQFAGTHHLNIDVGADLHIWGPEFAGTAHIKLDIISFDINFGSGSSKKLQPIDWKTFRESFLPKSKDGGLEICGVSVADGLLGTPAKNTNAESDNNGAKNSEKSEVKDSETDTSEGAALKVDWIVNPKTFLLVTNSVIPSKEAYKGSAPFVLDDKVRTAFGIGPMAVTSADIFSRHTVSISRWNSGGENKEGQSGAGGFVPDDDNFELRPLTKNVPVALWGESLTPSMNGPAFVGDTLSGFEVRPRAQPAPGVTADINRSALQYETQPVAPAYKWESFRPFVARSFGETDESLEEERRRAAVLDSINSDATTARRARLLGALGVMDGIELSGYGADDFLIPPQVEAAES